MYHRFKKLFTTTNNNSTIQIVQECFKVNTSAENKPEVFLNVKLAGLQHHPQISQSQRVFCSNLLVHSSEKTIRETPHLILHTLEQEARLQVIPDHDIFNTKYHKYGDFVNVKTEKSIEVKTCNILSPGHLDSLKEQYKDNKRNSDCEFSILYNKLSDITENHAKEFLVNELKLETNQVVIKSFESIADYFTHSNIEKAIGYYDIPWPIFQTENHKRLLCYLEEIVT
jgi:hypothetical protein